jgi:hypothetical protein
VATNVLDRHCRLLQQAVPLEAELEWLLEPGLAEQQALVQLAPELMVLRPPARPARPVSRRQPSRPPLLGNRYSRQQKR